MSMHTTVVISQFYTLQCTSMEAIGDGHTPWNKGIFLQEDGPSQNISL